MKPSLPTMTVDPTILSGLESAVRTEWLVTNGLGGYASSTVWGVNTRKYHGLLVAALNPPVDRRVLLAKLDEEILLSSARFNLGISETKSKEQPQDIVSPCGFALAPLPTYAYSFAQGFQLKKTIFVPHEKNASIVLYEVVNGSCEKAKLSVSPLINCRDFHSVTDRNQIQYNIKQENSGRLLFAQPSTSFPTLALFSTD